MPSTKFNLITVVNIMENTKDLLNRVQKHMQNVGKEDPTWMGSFQKFMQESKKEGVLSTKVKELMGIALSVKSQCERCIAWHVKSAMDHGATKAEIFESALVAVSMSGGPGLMYMEDVIKAVNDFSN